MKRSDVAIAIALLALGASTAWSARASGAKPRPRAPRPAPTAPAPPEPATSAPAPLPAGAVEITVVEVAGSRAYVRPGAAAGVARGASVVLHGKTYVVLEASDSFAVIEVGEDRVREQETGRATRVAAGTAERATELPKPRPLATWSRAWAPAAPPADAQRPAFVPLGNEAGDRRYDVRLTLLAGALLPLSSRQVGSSLALGELNARVHAEPFAAPIRLDVDASLRGWTAADLASRVGGPTRSSLYVRELVASYAGGRFYAGVGRLRYAASTLGTLDGGRAQADLGGGFTLGAFGGALPNPMSGEPSLDAQRFGVEARYARSDLAWRPEAALVVHGSMFKGALDERRVSGVFGAYPGDARLGGYFELSSFDANNPWKEPAIALTAAGVDPSVRLGPFTLGARVDVRQPEVSRWMASFLPLSWLCRTVPAPGATPTAAEPCDGAPSLRAFGEVDAGVELDRFSLVLGGTTVKELHQSNEADMVGGFATARVVRLARALRVEATGAWSRATFVDLYGGTVGPGLTLLDDALDLSAYYRLSVLKYRVSDGSLAQNGVGAAVALFPSAAVLFTFQGEGTTGDDVRALTLFGTVTWRPRF